VKLNNIIRAIDIHVAGEPLRFIVDGIPVLRGKTMNDKMNYMKENHDHLRKSALREPRGFRDIFGGIVTEPVTENADCGVFYLDCGTYYPMCGTGTIGLAVMLVNTGRVKAIEPVTTVTIDTPGGQVSCDVNVKDGHTNSAEYVNVPSFLYRKAVEVESSSFGKLKVDIGYGGNFVIFIKSEDIGVELNNDNKNELIEPALEITEKIRKKVKIQHPKQDIDYIDSCMYIDERPGNLLVIGKGQVSRSASGTGTPARMAREHAYGNLVVGEEFIHTGLIGTKLYGRIIKETKVGDLTATISRIKSQAFITGFHELFIDQEDPLKEGIFI